jgi:SAM-dependent methyltransferase
MSWDVPTLSHAEARRIYDRIGSKQDTQAFYEDRATNELIPHLRLGAASSVFEFGCGTGRFAARLLREHLTSAASYRAVDLSPTMVALARSRLAPFGERAQVALTDGRPPAGEPSAAFDRFVSNYVLDLLSLDDARAVVGEAHRMLGPGGLLGLASLTNGFGFGTRLFDRLWSGLHALAPTLVGGCRGIEILDLLSQDRWKIIHVARVSALGVPLEAVAAERI